MSIHIQGFFCSGSAIKLLELPLGVAHDLVCDRQPFLEENPKPENRRKAGAEIRNPKSEGGPKSESRNPKQPAADSHSALGFRIGEPGLTLRRRDAKGVIQCA